jgi:hypothetical protein
MNDYAAGPMASFHPPTSFLSKEEEEEEWKAMNDGTMYAKNNSMTMNGRCVVNDPGGAMSFTPTPYYNQSNIGGGGSSSSSSNNNITININTGNGGGYANGSSHPNIHNSYSSSGLGGDHHRNYSNNGVGNNNFFFNSLGMMFGNTHTAPSTTATTTATTNTITDTESSMNYNNNNRNNNAGFHNYSLGMSSNNTPNAGISMINELGFTSSNKNNSNIMGVGDSTTQMYWTAMAPSPALPEYSNYPIGGGFRCPPPPQMMMMPSTATTTATLPCLTPDIRPLSCPPNPPDSPMYLDSHHHRHHHPYQQPLPTDAASVISQVSSVDQYEEHRVTPVAVEIDKEKSTSSTGGSRFLLRGIGTVSSALGTVAGYVNQGLLLGIPFHIADRAMKESRGLYTKWWDQEVGGRKRKSSNSSSSQDDGTKDALEEESRAGCHPPAGKKRRLEDSRSAGTATPLSRVASTLTMSLTKNYDTVLMEKTTCNIVQNKLGSSSSRNPKAAAVQEEVDSSIIKPRRGLNKLHHPSSNLDGSFGLRISNTNSGGYDALNDFGGMYGSCGVVTERNHHRQDDGGGIGEFNTMQEAVTFNSKNCSAYASSIISNPRRSLNQPSSNPNNSGYDAFNDIGGMYDFGASDSSSENGHNETDDSGNDADTEQALTPSSNFNRRSANASTHHHDGHEKKAPQSKSSSAASAPSSTSGTTWRNLDGTMKIIGELLAEKNRLSEENEIFQMVASPRDWVKKSIRSELIDALGSGKGDVKDKRFLSVLDILSNFYKTSGRDARVSPWSGSGFDGGKYKYNGGEVGGPTSCDFYEGHWVNMSRPNYIECLGENGDNDFMYTLGRMSFDMFQPSNLICSVQSTHTNIKIIGEREELPAFVPKSLKDEVASLCDFDDGTTKRPLLRSYE